MPVGGFYSFTLGLLLNTKNVISICGCHRIFVELIGCLFFGSSRHCGLAMRLAQPKLALFM